MKKIHSPETVFYGDEPTWDSSKIETIKDTDCALLKAFNWYRYMASESECKKWLLEYLKENKYSMSIITVIGTIDPKDIYIFYGQIPGKISFNTGMIARMLFLKAPLPNQFKKDLDIAINYLVNKYSSKSVEIITTPDENKPNVQRFINEQCSAVIAELDLLFDQTLTGNHKLSEKDSGTLLVHSEIETKPVNIKELLKSKNLKSVHFGKIKDYFCSTYSDLNKIKEDAELKEAYSSYSNKNLEKTRKIIADIITACEELSTEYKSTKIRIRKKRFRPPAVIVKKLKYKKDDSTFKLNSISPTKIVGADKLVIFNTKYRTVSLFEADSHHGLSIKGTTVIQFDPKKSVKKKLRNPEKFFGLVKDKGIRAFKSAFDSVKAVESPVKGRINEDCIIIEVY